MYVVVRDKLLNAHWRCGMRVRENDNRAKKGKRRFQATVKLCAADVTQPGLVLEGLRVVDAHS